MRARGLDAGRLYRVSGFPGVFSGQLLMSAGLPVPGSLLQYEAVQFEILAVEPEAGEAPEGGGGLLERGQREESDA